MKIDDKTKSVGDTSITIDGQSRERTVNGDTIITGLLDGCGWRYNDRWREDRSTGCLSCLRIMAVEARAGEAENVDVGFTYDSSDDSARVTLVHSYLGTAKQMQFLRSGDDNPFNGDNGAPTVALPSLGQTPLDPNTDSTDDGITNGAVTIAR